MAFSVGDLVAVLKMETADFTGPAREAGESVRSSGSLIQSSGSLIKSALGEALSGTVLSEFGAKWQEVAEVVGGSAEQVESSATSAGNATKSALSASGGNELATSMQQASTAAQEFAQVMTTALSQIKGELNLGDSAGLEALDAELQTTAADAQTAAAEIAESMQSIDAEMQQTGEIAQTSAGEVSAAMATITSSIEGAVASGSELQGLNAELMATGAASQEAGSSAVAGGSAISGAFALAPQIALITAATMAISKLPEAIDSVKDAAKDYDESIQTVQQLTGATVQDSSLLVDVFQRYGISAQQASKDIDQLSRSAVAATQSATGPQATAYEQLGVSLTNYDGTLKDSTTLFYQVGQALASMPDGIQKTNDELQIFGRSGTDLNEMFHATNDSGQDWIHTVAGMEQQAQSTGQVLTGAGMTSFERYQQATRDSSAASAALKEQLGNAFLPVMTDVDNGLASLAGGFDTKVLPALGRADDEFKSVWSELSPLRQGLQEVGEEAGGGLTDAIEGLGELLGGPFGGVVRLLAVITLVGLIATLVALVAPIVAVGLAVKGLEAIFDDAGGSIKGVETLFSDSKDWLYQAGVNFDKGFISGVEDGVNDVIDAVTNLGKSAVSGFESSLGINSPSTKGIAAGLNYGSAVGLGVQQSHPFVASAIAGLGQLMSTSGHSAAVGAASQMVAPMAASASQANAQPVVIHNYMGNKPIETVVGTAMNGVFRQQSRRQN